MYRGSAAHIHVRDEENQKVENGGPGSTFGPGSNKKKRKKKSWNCGNMGLWGG